MKKLISHIEYLVRCHDCVVVPGLGAILAHDFSADYNEAECVWHAPRRLFTFNPELSHTDGLIAASIARKDGVSNEVAAQQVKAAVDEMRQALERDSKVSLGAVGSLIISEHSTLLFEPSCDGWLSPAYQWLPTFTLPYMAAASEVADSAEHERRKAIYPARIARRIAGIAASVAVVFALGWLIVQSLGTMPASQYASVAPTISPVEQEDVIDDTKSTLVLVINRHADASELVDQDQDTDRKTEKQNKTADNVVNQLQTKESQQAIRLNENDSYYLIVASLGTEAEARQYLAQHSDINLGILAVDGRYRIYAATGRSMAEAMNMASAPAIKTRYRDAWVCRN